jgi:hypothetical protein
MRNIALHQRKSSATRLQLSHVLKRSAGTTNLKVWESMRTSYIGNRTPNFEIGSVGWPC